MKVVATLTKMCETDCINYLGDNVLEFQSFSMDIGNFMLKQLLLK